jgi:hypothetical protein
MDARWSMRWRIDTREKLRSVVASIAGMLVGKQPLELILRTERVPIAGVQRRRFHAICADIAPHVGLTPGKVKLHVKADFYGLALVWENAIWVEVIQSSEDSESEEYERLAEHALQWAAEKGVFIPDPRPREL